MGGRDHFWDLCSGIRGGIEDAHANFRHIVREGFFSSLCEGESEQQMVAVALSSC